VSFRESGAEKLPFGDGSFSAVLLFDVLEHVASPDVVLNELYRVLRPGGVLHIFSPLDKQPMTMHWLLYSLGWKAKDRYTGHVHWFSDRSFRTLLDTHGFVLQKKRFSFHQILSLFDIIYYSFQAVLGMSAPDGTLAGSLRRKRSGWAFLLFLFYQLIVAVGFYESRFLWWFPWATGGHYMSIKRQK
jgi:SAM-dependent methyltransferase